MKAPSTPELNIYKHIAGTTSEIHTSLLRWVREILIEAGVDDMEVYGRFQPEGSQGTHLTLFLYMIVPAPKLVETSTGASLLAPRDRRRDHVAMVPGVWLELGQALKESLRLVFSSAVNPDGTRKTQTPPRPYPMLDELEPPLQKWYRMRQDMPDAGEWLIEDGEIILVRPPALWWRRGVILTYRYLALVHEPGRGVRDPRLSSSPLALRTLGVLNNAIQMRRNFAARLDPPPMPEELETFATAVADSLDLMPSSAAPSDDDAASPAVALPDPADCAKRLRSALGLLRQKETIRTQLVPIKDMNNNEMARLMQALQRPLKPTTNLQLRIPVGAHCLFGSSTAVAVAVANSR